MIRMHGVENPGNRRAPAQLRLFVPHVRGTERKATTTALRLPKSRKESKFTDPQRKQMPDPLRVPAAGSLKHPHQNPHFPSPLGSFLSW